jgi:hypothetical protein
MNYIRHLSLFYEKVVADNRLNPSHISLYIALFQVWNSNRFQNPISVCREQMLLLSRIGSLHTYYKCMYALQSWGYIQYLPSRNPIKGSLVNLCIFDTSSTETEFNLCKNDISGDAKMHPSINNINIVNNKTFSGDQAQNEIQILNSKNMVTVNQNSKRKKVAQKKENGFIKPNLDEVIVFFRTENFPDIEAKKFFNHFESNGWRVGGKSPMKNWNAAARNWMLNSQKFIPSQNFQKLQQKPKPDPNNKNYAEPL